MTRLTKKQLETIDVLKSCGSLTTNKACEDYKTLDSLVKRGIAIAENVGNGYVEFRLKWGV